MTKIALPPSWVSKRLKYLATHNNEVLAESTDEEKEIDYIEISGVSLSRGIEEITRIAFGKAPSRARRKVRSGDILISTVRTYLRAIATVDEAPPNLIASTGFCVVRPNDDVDSGFVGWAVKSESFVSEIVARSIGVSYPAINASELVTIDMPLPPLDTQRRIARFLDEKTTQINTLIEKKRELLDRLAEKRQALITRAVTKGLDSITSVPTKTFGSGEVPLPQPGREEDCRVVEGGGGIIFAQEHQSQRLKWLFLSCKNGAWGAEPDGESDVVCIRAADFDGRLGRLNIGERTLRSIDSEIYKKLALRTGDIILEKSGGGEKQLVGRAVLFTGEDSSITSNFLARCRPSSNMEPAFVNYLLLAIYNTRGTFPHIKQSTGIQNLDLDSFLNIRVRIPPLDTQRRIAQFLDEKTARIDEVGTQVLRSIELLSEYRSALITSAVTGKINVRGALPEATEAEANT